MAIRDVVWQLPPKDSDFTTPENVSSAVKTLVDALIGMAGKERADAWAVLK